MSTLRKHNQRQQKSRYKKNVDPRESGKGAKEQDQDEGNDG